MSERDDTAGGQPQGPFMRAVARGAPHPPAARTLGLSVIEADPAAGRIEVGFEATEAFTDPYGEVLGGFLAAMLYDTAGPAVLATLADGEFIVTHQLRCDFLAPARVGKLSGRGLVVRRDGAMATVAATLADRDGKVVATAEASIEVVRRDPPAA